MSGIVLTNIDKFYGSNHVLKNVNLTIENGEFMTLVGPSGCGKTTTLRVISGLERPQNGTMTMDGKLMINVKEQFFESPKNRSLNLVFQSYALWPHMTVFDNVAFGLQVEKRPKKEISEIVMQSLERMQIGEFSKRYPSELSGGQQQRVAIARAIASNPGLLLLDEPLSNLDAKLRIDMRSEIKRLHKDMGTTVIYVTHDQVEALTMSTRIAVFFDGEIEQVDAPMDVYQNPSTLRVAEFIGNPKINILEGRASVKNGEMSVTCALGNFIFDKKYFNENTPTQGEFDCAIGLRPEQMTLTKNKSGENNVKTVVYSSMPAGSETLIQLRLGKENILCKELGLKNYTTDEQLYLNIDPDLLNIFNKSDGKIVKLSATVT